MIQEQFRLTLDCTLDSGIAFIPKEQCEVDRPNLQIA